MLAVAIGCADSHGGETPGSSVPADTQRRWLAAETDEGLSIIRFDDVESPVDHLVAERGDHLSWWYKAKWSKDGRFLAFQTPDADENSGMKLWIANADGEGHQLELPPATARGYTSPKVDYEWIDDASLLIRVWLAGDPEVTDFYRVRAEASTSLEWIDTQNGLGGLGPIGPTGGAVIGTIDEVVLVTDNSPPVHLEGLESRSACIGSDCNGDLCGGLYWSPDGKWLASCAPMSPQSGAKADPNIHIGRIPLPAELTSSSGGPSSYDPEMAPYSEPWGLTWGPDGTLVAYLLDHYLEPIFDDEHWATCTREIVFADVATAQVLRRSTVPCVDLSWSPLMFLDAETVLYADDQHSLLARIDDEPVQLEEPEGERWHRLFVTQDRTGVYLLTGITAADNSEEASLRFSPTDALPDGGEWSTLWTTRATRTRLLFTNAPEGSAAMLIIANDRFGCTDDCDDVIHVFDGNAETTLVGSLHIDLQPRFPYEVWFTPDGRGIVTSRRDGVFLSAGDAYADEYRLRDQPALDHAPNVSLILPSLWPDD